jgi:putative DNA-invertase from lambdoid prophage Rac
LKPQGPESSKQPNLFGQGVKTMKAAIYARVSRTDQKTLPMQIQTLKRYAKSRGWGVVLEVTDTASGASDRPRRDEILSAARRRDIDAVLVWKLDRWGRSLIDLMSSLRELTELGVGFVSMTEALDLTTTTGRAMSGMLAIFADYEREILRERVRMGMAQARLVGRMPGRPKTAALKSAEVRRLRSEGRSPSEIARRLGISRTSVRRLLAV